jgi:hypothetical protein
VVDRSREQIKEIDLDILKDYQENWVASKGLSLQLSDFPIYGARLQHIRMRMKEWRPPRLRQVWRRPYKDPLPYYGFWFAVFLGVAAVTGVALNIAQLKQSRSSG